MLGCTTPLPLGTCTVPIAQDVLLPQKSLNSAAAILSNKERAARVLEVNLLWNDMCRNAQSVESFPSQFAGRVLRRGRLGQWRLV